MEPISRLEYLEKLRAALQYDTINRCIYTYEGRRAVHNEIIRVMNSEKTEIIPFVVIPLGIGNRRECRLNSARQTEVFDKIAGVWRIVKSVKKLQ